MTNASRPHRPGRQRPPCHEPTNDRTPTTAEVRDAICAALGGSIAATPTHGGLWVALPVAVNDGRAVHVLIGRAADNYTLSDFGLGAEVLRQHDVDLGDPSTRRAIDRIVYRYGVQFTQNHMMLHAPPELLGEALLRFTAAALQLDSLTALGAH
jgi:hypothetical protein